MAIWRKADRCRTSVRHSAWSCDPAMWKNSIIFGFACFFFHIPSAGTNYCFFLKQILPKFATALRWGGAVVGGGGGGVVKAVACGCHTGQCSSCLGLSGPPLTCRPARSVTLMEPRREIKLSDATNNSNRLLNASRRGRPFFFPAALAVNYGPETLRPIQTRRTFPGGRGCEAETGAQLPARLLVRSACLPSRRPGSTFIVPARQCRRRNLPYLFIFFIKNELVNFHFTFLFLI